MTPHGEFALYHNDRSAWARYAAPRWAEMLKDADTELRRYLWRVAGPELRTEITALAKKEQEQ